MMSKINNQKQVRHSTFRRGRHDMKDKTPRLAFFPLNFLYFQFSSQLVDRHKNKGEKSLLWYK